ncbi:interferon lambda receptor 1 isoform X2 [Oryctolagus cuniculus]|uniref:interferon lambda receptor 1 isoform X2 n=1 Tax=Oryctolagus cuniculus TaxID=9986 RepID=UPI003879FCA9
MAGACRWASLLLCLLQTAPGRPALAPPQNVSLLSQNFSVYLTWLPGPGNPQDVTYFVAYQSSPSPRWRRVDKCAGTRELVCSLMCLKNQDLYNKFRGRVRVASPSAKSSWVESKYLDYLFEVELAPPTLLLTHMEEILSVNATYQLPPCMPPLDLKYEVEFWKEGTRNKIPFPVTPYGQAVWVPLQPTASGWHCLHARTIHTFIVPRYSKFSKPSCFFLEAPANLAFLVMPSLLPPLLVVATGGVIWKSLMGSPWFQRAKTPQALCIPWLQGAPAPDSSSCRPWEAAVMAGVSGCLGTCYSHGPSFSVAQLQLFQVFSGPRCPVATLQPSGPESLETLLLCPRKELTRRAPGGAQAGSESRAGAEEARDDPASSEEDSDDSACFQPYLGAPPFLRREPPAAGHAETEGSRPGSAGAPTPPGPSSGSSAWDCSGRSWASAGEASWPWAEAGSSECLAKRGLGPEPGGSEHPGPPPPGAFSQGMDSLAEPLQDDPGSWATWSSPPPRLGLLPGEPPVSLRTLTFCWDSSPEEEEEGEEEEEEEDRRESESEHSDPGSSGAETLQRPEARGRVPGHYMARSAGLQPLTPPGAPAGFPKHSAPQQDPGAYVPR